VNSIQAKFADRTTFVSGHLALKKVYWFISIGIEKPNVRSKFRRRFLTSHPIELGLSSHAKLLQHIIRLAFLF
jgi:hypothetical protein